MWESAWRSCIERQLGKKCHPGNLETPLQSRSGPRFTGLTIKGKPVSSPLGRASDKATPTIVNPLIPLSLPFWSLPTPSRDSLQSSALARGSVGDRQETSHTCNTDILSGEMRKQTVASVKSPLHKACDERPEDPMKFNDGISTSININENSSRGSKCCIVPDFVNPIDVLPESETEIQASLTVGSGSENMEENNMKEGSLFEVFKDEGGLKPAWFTGNILSLKDGKAYVGYSVLLDDEGVGPLKEWASLESEGEKPPRIRIARPLTGLHNEGTRKRERTSMVDYTWSVGDSVDGWIQESWQEGVITDKNKKDETTLGVHFPACGETSVVRAWHLHPSLIWKDGKWIEPSRMKANSSSTH